MKNTIFDHIGRGEIECANKVFQTIMKERLQTIRDSRKVAVAATLFDTKKVQ